MEATTLQSLASPATAHSSSIDVKVLLQVGEEQLARLAAQVEQQVGAQADLHASLDKQLRQVGEGALRPRSWLHRVCSNMWFMCWTWRMLHCSVRTVSRQAAAQAGLHARLGGQVRQAAQAEPFCCSCCHLLKRCGAEQSTLTWLT